MTREEEIKCASKDYVNYLLDKQKYHNEDYTEYDIRQAFEKGAMFADNNPYLSSLWHDASEEPKINEDVVLYDCCGNFIAEFFDGSVTWRNIVLYYKATMWVYADDLLPKGDKK